MKVTVCELENGWLREERDWEWFLEQISRQASDLLLLPEMALFDWLCGTPDVDEARWREAVEAHERWIDRFAECPVPRIVGSRPVLVEGEPYNQGFVWDRAHGLRPIHTKYYLPDEEGFWEATWYRRARAPQFLGHDLGELKVGMMICTDLWFQQHAREYAESGVHLLVCPRATPSPTWERWRTGGQCASVVAGAYGLSSNLSGPNRQGPDFGGAGWVIEPEEGEVLGVTDKDRPFLTVTIDPGEAERAKLSYPRYVRS